MSKSVENRGDACDFPATGANPQVFVTTHWSVVRAAGHKDSTEARAALEKLCCAYWHPLYHYVRRRGYSAADAQDLTQQFFFLLLQRQKIAVADPNRGRFRSFLLAALKNFLADEWDKARSQKRGGGLIVSMDFETEEKRLRNESVDEVTPERAYEKRWALALLEQVCGQLQVEAEAAGKAVEFAILRPALMGDSDALPYAQIGEQLGLSEGAARVASHRLRQRYRQVLREKIAETLTDGESVEAEIRYLLQVLAA